MTEPFAKTISTIRAEPELAPCAMRAGDSRGRRVPEAEHHFRSPFQRDRDRVIHCRAFRRLDGKTQVFLSGSGDHFRTRLTHTIEVAAIARTLARSLRLNEDLAEAIALAHDLGHTPFGHMGEHVLNALLAPTPIGGFDHNHQSLRVVDVLERKYPGTEGLNLTFEVRAGLLKHRTADTTLDGVRVGLRTSLEAQVAQIADDVAYCTHDLDDGIESGLLNPRGLRHVRLWELARAQALDQGGDETAEYFPSFVVRCVIDMLVGDIIAWSSPRIADLRTPQPDGVEPRIGFSPAIRDLAEQLKAYLFKHVYRHPKVMSVNRRVATVVRQLFEQFVAHPEQMGVTARARAARESPERAAADYLAGMTDRYALQAFADLPAKAPKA